MRCASIKKNKCWNTIEFELTSHSIRFFINFFHIDVVHLSLLEGIGLVGTFNFLFWALISIVSHLLTLEAFNLTEIFLWLWWFLYFACLWDPELPLSS